MSRQYYQIKPNVKVTSLAQSRVKVNFAWLADFTFYFFSFFFSSITWRALAEH